MPRGFAHPPARKRHGHSRLRGQVLPTTVIAAVLLAAQSALVVCDAIRTHALSVRVSAGGIQQLGHDVLLRTPA